MTKLKPLYLLFSCLIICYANSNNPPNGRTGAPGDGTCTDCHEGSGGGFEGTVSLQGLPEDIVPNTTYNLQISTRFSSGSPSRAGFQMVVLDGGDSNAGSFTNFGPSTETESRNGRQYLEHRPAKSFDENMEASWTADWTSPATASNDQIKIYINSIIGNGSGTSGDLMVSSQTTFNLKEEIVIQPINSQIIEKQNVSCFNDSDGQARVNATGGDGSFSYEWSNGLMVENATNLSAGTYQVTITDGLGTTTTNTVVIDQPDQLTVEISSLIEVNCTNEMGSAKAQANGGTSPYNYEWSTNSVQQDVSLQAGMHSLTLTDANDCTITQVLTIAEDRQMPIANAGNDIMIDCSATTTSTQIDASASSSGTNYAYSWTTTDGDILSGETTLMPTVTTTGTYALQVVDSNNGCTNTDEVSIIFAPLTNCSTGSIAGKVTRENGMPISNVSMVINNNSAILTSNDGLYNFENISFNSAPEIIPSKLDGVTEEVTTFDLVLITRHILNAQLLDTPYKLIAADANASGSITTFDVVVLRKVILGIDNQFLNNTSWRFIPSTIDLPTDIIPADFPSTLSINSFTENQLNQDFIGIKTGDVSYTISNTIAAEARSKAPLLLEMATEKFEANTSIDIPIQIPNLKDFSGFQLELAFDPSMLQLQQINTTGFLQLAADNVSYKYLKEGKILISWLDNNQSNNDQTSNLNLSFTTKHSGNTSSAIWITEKHLVTEAYTKALQIKEIVLTKEDPLLANSSTIQLYPNPASNLLTINVPIKYPSIKEIALFNTMGEKVITVKNPKTEANNITLFLKGLSDGTYFIMLSTNQEVITKKVMVIGQ